MVGDFVLSLEGVHDKITSVDRFEGNFDPKPMLEIAINGYTTSTTYDHKYFNGHSYVPLYQLVWGIMDASQKRTLELLCEQYGAVTNNELQGWLQNRGNETSSESKRVSCYSGRWESADDTQNNSKNIYPEPREQRDRQPQERYKDRQPSGELGMGNTNGAVRTSVENRTENRPSYTGRKLQEDDRNTSARVITVSLGQSNHTNTIDGEVTTGTNWYQLRWDTGFAKWKDLETLAGGVSTQTTDILGSEAGRIEVLRVYESVDVWSITTEKHHNYFANGVNVSNSLKSHSVARVLLIRARQSKIRVGCFREFQNSIAESSHQLLCDLITQYNLNDYLVTDKTITNKVTGSDFIFKGLWNNDQSIKSIEGIDIAWVEEAQTITKSSLEILTPTVRKDNSQIIYTYNRLTVSDPVHTRLVEEGRPNTLLINVNYDVAEKYGFLPDVIKQEIEDDRLKRPVLYKQKWLGEPYVSPNDLLSTMALTKCLLPETNAQGDRIIIGVDTGHDIYYTLMNKQGVFFYGYCQSPQEVNDPNYDPYDTLDKLMTRFPRSIMVADQGGDLIGIRKLQAKYKGRVYLCWFVKETKSQQIIRWAENEEDGKVLVDRNRMIQMVVDQINDQRIGFNGSKEDWLQFFEHCLNIYRIKEITGEENDPQYGWRWVWKRKGPDHWFMSMIYGLVGLDRFAQDLATVVHKNGAMRGIEKAMNVGIINSTEEL